MIFCGKKSVLPIESFKILRILKVVSGILTREQQVGERKVDWGKDEKE